MRKLLMITLSVVLAGWGVQHVEQWRNGHKLPNRYEGVGFPVNQSTSAVLTLVSFVAHKEELDVRTPTDLIVQFYSKGAPAVSVIAHELSPFHNYRMEALPPEGGWRAGWDRFSGWSTADVLGPKNISIKALGLLVSVRSDDPVRPYLAPAILHRAESPPKGMLEAYRADFVSTVPLTGGSFHVLTGCGPTADSRGATERPIGSQEANFTFHLNLAMSGIAEGTKMLRVRLFPGTAKTTDPVTPITREYCFDHQPSIPAK